MSQRLPRAIGMALLGALSLVTAAASPARAVEGNCGRAGIEVGVEGGNPRIDIVVQVATTPPFENIIRGSATGFWTKPNSGGAFGSLSPLDPNYQSEVYDGNNLDAAWINENVGFGLVQIEIPVIEILTTGGLCFGLWPKETVFVENIPSGSASIRDEVLLTSSDAVDLAFVIDTTGSMADDLAAVKSSVSQILTEIQGQTSNFRVAVVQYNDPTAGVILGFSSNTSAITGAVNSLTASGGGDFPEHVYSGIAAAANLPWRKGARRSIIVLGDAPPKDPEPGTGYTQSSVLALVNSLEVDLGSGTTASSFGGGEGTVADLELGSSTIANTTNTVRIEYPSFVRIQPVLIGTDSSTEASFQALADGSGGQLVRALNASQVVAAILQAINQNGTVTSVKAQYRPEDTVTGDSEIRPYLKVVNNGSANVPLSDLTLRYWFTAEPGGPFTVNCSFATVGCGNLQTSVVPLAQPRTGANAYLEVKFTSGAGSVAPGTDSGEIKLRINDQLWQPFNETNDYSFDASKVNGYADWNRVTIYRAGKLVWGQEP